MKLAVASLLTLSLFAPTSTPAETQGQQLNLAVNAGSGVACIGNTVPIACSNVPLVGGGSFSLSDYYANQNQASYIDFTGVADLGNATITGSTPTLDSLRRVSQVVIELNGIATDGVPFTGTATLSFVYHLGGVGRYTYWLRDISSGTIQVVYQ